MEKLTMESIIKKGEYANQQVSDLVNNKGVIFSLIKEGFEFDDVVLDNAHIKKNIRNEDFVHTVGKSVDMLQTKVLAVDTASLKQILSGINTLASVPNKYEEEYSSNSENIYDYDDEKYEND